MRDLFYPRARLEHQRFVEAYNILIKRLPGFQTLINEFQKNEYGTQWESLLQDVRSPLFGFRLRDNPCTSIAFPHEWFVS